MIENTTFALIGNPSNAEHMYKCISFYKPDLKISPKALQKVFEWTPPYKGTEIPMVKSKTGKTINGFHVVCTFIPEMINLSYTAVSEKIMLACKTAKQNGALIGALGGFTSIGICDRQDLVAKEAGIALTSGNSLTAFLASKGAETAAKIMGLELANATVTVIGASGDVGSGCAKYFAGKVKTLILTARGLRNLRLLAYDLEQYCKTKIYTTLDNLGAVRNSDIVITTTSAVTAILKGQDFKKSAIVCDVGYPKNVDISNETRPDIFAFSGGLAEMPCDINFGYELNLPMRNVIYGCYAEGLVLSFENRITNFSSGRGKITVSKMEEIGYLANKHGFKPALFYLGKRKMSEHDIEKIKKCNIDGASAMAAKIKLGESYCERIN